MLEAIAFGQDPKIRPVDRLKAIQLLANEPSPHDEDEEANSYLAELRAMAPEDRAREFDSFCGRAVIMHGVLDPIYESTREAVYELLLLAWQEVGPIRKKKEAKRQLVACAEALALKWGQDAPALYYTPYETRLESDDDEYDLEDDSC